VGNFLKVPRLRHELTAWQISITGGLGTSGNIAFALVIPGRSLFRIGSEMGCLQAALHGPIGRQRFHPVLNVNAMHFIPVHTSRL
jgi:hypothetical protein